MSEPLFVLVVRAGAPLADAIGSLLFESGAGGIEEREAGSATELRVYATERPDVERLARTVEVHLSSLGCAAPDASVVVEEITDSRWQTLWTEYLVPERVTERLVVQPVGDRTPAPPGTRRIFIEPRLAFGVGSHPTTRLAAGAVERYVAANPGCSVLDVGTGNGVLAFVALLSGAGRATGIDTDPVAIAAARHNAGLNALPGEAVFLEDRLETMGGQFSLVVANIDTETLLGLAPALASRTGEHLVLSGMLVERAEEVARAFIACGFETRARQTERDWALLSLCRGTP